MASDFFDPLVIPTTRTGCVVKGIINGAVGAFLTYWAFSEGREAQLEGATRFPWIMYAFAAVLGICTVLFIRMIFAQPREEIVVVVVEDQPKKKGSTIGTITGLIALTLVIIWWLHLLEIVDWF